MNSLKEILNDLYFSLKNLPYKLSKPFRFIKKMYDWYMNVFRNDFDWDHAYFHNVMRYKLQRMLHALETGVAEQGKRELQALRLAIKLLSRLYKDQYDDRLYDRHEAKWGELVVWFTPIEKPGYSQYHSRRTKANTELEKEQERADHLNILNTAYFLRQRDKKWLYGILTKYEDSWWE